MAVDLQIRRRILRPKDRDKARRVEEFFPSIFPILSTQLRGYGRPGVKIFDENILVCRIVVFFKQRYHGTSILAESLTWNQFNQAIDKKWPSELEWHCHHEPKYMPQLATTGSRPHVALRGECEPLHILEHIEEHRQLRLNARFDMMDQRWEQWLRDQEKAKAEKRKADESVALPAKRPAYTKRCRDYTRAWGILITQNGEVITTKELGL